MESTLYVYRIDFDDVSKRLQSVSSRLVSKRLCIEMTELLWDFFLCYVFRFFQDLSGHPLGKKLSRPFQDLESYLQEVEDTEFR